MGPLSSLRGSRPKQDYSIRTVEETLDTVEQALAKAKTRIPTGAKIEAEEIKIEPDRTVRQVKAKSEKLAEKRIRLNKAETIESISLNEKGRRRFFFFKTPNLYDVVVAQRAVVKIRFGALTILR